jgi:hypothetical protein
MGVTMTLTLSRAEIIVGFIAGALAVLALFIAIIAWLFPRTPSKVQIGAAALVCGIIVLIIAAILPFLPFSGKAGYEGMEQVGCGSLVFPRSDFSAYPINRPTYTGNPNNPPSQANASVKNGLSGASANRSEAIGSCRSERTTITQITWAFAALGVVSIVAAFFTKSQKKISALTQRNSPALTLGLQLYEEKTAEDAQQRPQLQRRPGA